jgi:hypothetical protein
MTRADFQACWDRWLATEKVAFVAGAPGVTLRYADTIKLGRRWISSPRLVVSEAAR